MSTLFHDCFGREINVGDVVAKAHYNGDQALAVVRGFTAQKIVVDEIIGHAYDHEKQRYTRWHFVKTRYTIGRYCFITGMVEADLRKIIEITDSEEWR